MRLSEWQKAAPTRDSMNNRVVAVLKPVLTNLGANADPECWVAWGEDPGLRYSVLAPTVIGLITAAVRPSSPNEGPRATAKLIRWSKLSVSELGIEASGGHRLVAVQVESYVLKGVDEEADRICEFVRGLVAAVDGRSPQPIPTVLVSAAAPKAAAAEAIAPSGARAAAGPKSRKLPGAAVPRRLPAAPSAGAAVAGRVASGSSRAGGRASGRPARAPSIKRVATAVSGAVAAASAPQAAASAAPPKMIPARVPTRRRGLHPDKGAGPAAPSVAKEVPDRHEQPEPEPARSEWISPHPIEEAPSREEKRPRPWTP